MIDFYSSFARFRAVMKTVSFIAAATLVLARPVSDLFARDSFRVTSPDGKVITTISAKAPNGLFYSIEYQRKPVILESPIGVRLSTRGLRWFKRN